MKYFIFLIVFASFVFVPTVHAEAMVTITPSGEVYKSVLGESTDTTANSKLNDIVNVVVNKVANVVISQVDAKVQVALNDQNGSQTTAFDTTTGEPIVEIQKIIPSEKITIKKIDNQFGISQEEVTAITSLNVSIDPANQDISLETESGSRKLGVLPSSVLKTLINSKILSQTPTVAQMNVSETDKGELIYTVSGTRRINLFNIANVDVPVTATISATNGEVENINQPTLLRVFGFLFS